MRTFASMPAIIEYPDVARVSERSKHPTSEWWRSAVVYQIYTRSFYDSDGDGNGDLNGIIKKFDYLKYLGVDAIWLNPFFLSPWKDGGYDVKSYHKVDPKFGTNADMSKLIDTAHASGIKIILDLVINHTSDQHPWFLRALRPDMKKRREESNYNSSIDPVANVYVFRPEDPSNPDNPPNNWLHFFGPYPAWTKAITGEWYLHRFTPEQTDLDPRNPLVRSHIRKIVRRWIEDQKIDGIRIDVLDHTFHDELLRDFEVHPNPPGGGYLDEWKWYDRYLLDDAHELAREISKTIRTTNKNAVSIAELHYSDRISDFNHYTKFLTKGEIDVPFNFSLLDTVQRFGASGKEFKRVVDRYLKALPEGACPNFVMSNHDQIMRLVDRVGRENIRAVLMALLCLGNQYGSNIFFYNGDEIGMEKGSTINETNMNDPIGRLQGVAWSRDHVRTGLVWNVDKANSGYSENAAPWLPGGQTIDGRGIEEQSKDPSSQLNFTRDIISLRKQNEALRFGEYLPLDSGDDDLLCFGRGVVAEGGQKLLMLFNFSEQTKNISLSGVISGDVLRSTIDERTHERVAEQFNLQPHEGCIIRLNPLSDD
jgi:alpha-glucosidase